MRDLVNSALVHIWRVSYRRKWEDDGLVWSGLFCRDPFGLTLEQANQLTLSLVKLRYAERHRTNSGRFAGGDDQILFKLTPRGADRAEELCRATDSAPTRSD